MVSFLEVIPLVVVMVAGPQLLSAIFLATSEQWRRNSAAFLAGAAISISAIVMLSFALGAGTVGQGGSNTTLSAIVLAALFLAMVHTYRTRDEAEPPRWMGALESASPRFSFKLGFLLLGFFPSDLLTSIAVGSYLAARDAPWFDATPFIALTLLVLAGPSLTLAAFGDRSKSFLPKARNWMNDNAWIVNEAVLVLFIGLTANNLFG